MKEGSSAEEVKTLITMIDERKAVLVGGVPSKARKLLEKFFTSLGMKGKEVEGGPAYVSEATGGVKLIRHYGHVLEMYKRKQARAALDISRGVTKPAPSAKEESPLAESSAAAEPVSEDHPSAAAEQGEDTPAEAAPCEEAAPEGNDDSDSDSDEVGPALPGAVVIGPAGPPPGHAATEPEAEEEEAEPAVPRVGPALPVGITREAIEQAAESYRLAMQAEEDDTEGPQMPGQYKMQQLVAYEAANAMRNQGVDQKREDWMTVLPPEKRPLGLGADPAAAFLDRPREFSRKGVQSRGDTSKWTDTPADRERKNLALELGIEPVPADDKGKKRPGDNSDPYAAGGEVQYSRQSTQRESNSLLEQHQKQVKKKKKVEKKTGAKPFSFNREDMAGEKSNNLNNVDKIAAQFRSQFGSSGFERGM